MAPYVDFQAVRENVSLTQAMEYLGLKLKRQGDAYRGECPACKKGGERALVVTPSKGFYCFGAKKGGNDSTALVAHIKGINQREAGAELQERFVGTVTSSTARDTATATSSHSTSSDASPATDGMQPLHYLTNDHEVIELLGLSKPVCNAIGIGYAVKGKMKGRIAFPLRLPDGTLVGYLGLATTADMEPLILLPDNLDERCSAPKPAQKAEQAADDARKLVSVWRWPQSRRLTGATRQQRSGHAWQRPSSTAAGLRCA